MKTSQGGAVGHLKRQTGVNPGQSYLYCVRHLAASQVVVLVAGKCIKVEYFADISSFFVCSKKGFGWLYSKVEMSAKVPPFYANKPVESGPPVF